MQNITVLLYLEEYCFLNVFNNNNNNNNNDNNNKRYIFTDHTLLKMQACLDTKIRER